MPSSKYNIFYMEGNIELSLRPHAKAFQGYPSMFSSKGGRCKILAFPPYKPLLS